MTRKEIMDEILQLQHELGMTGEELRVCMRAESGVMLIKEMTIENLENVKAALEATVVSKEAESAELYREDWEDEVEKEIRESGAGAGKDDQDWDEVEPELPEWWTPQEVGSELKGKIMSLEEGAYGVVATILQEDGVEINTPAHKYLQSRLKNCEVGETIKISYKGKIRPLKGREAENYTVMRWRR